MTTGVHQSCRPLPTLSGVSSSSTYPRRDADPSSGGRGYTTPEKIEPEKSDLPKLPGVTYLEGVACFRSRSSHYRGLGVYISTQRSLILEARGGN